MDYYNAMYVELTLKTFQGLPLVWNAAARWGSPMRPRTTGPESTATVASKQHGPVQGVSTSIQSSKWLGTQVHQRVASASEALVVTTKTKSHRFSKRGGSHKTKHFK